MSSSTSFDALRRANPRNKASFATSVDAARARLATVGITDEPRAHHRRPRRRLIGVTVAGAAVAVTAVAVLLTTSSTRGVESAAAAIKKAVTLSAASAELSGTASVRMTHDGQLWAHKVVRWNGDDIEITDDTRERDDVRPRSLLRRLGRARQREEHRPG